MATLHVRNVPDALYEELRERAARNGRSIGAEIVVMLGREAGIPLPAPDLGRARTIPYGRPPRRRRTHFEHFNARARQVVVDAQDEAASLGSGSLGTEHLLLALLREPANVASLILEHAGLAYAAVRAAVEAAAGPGEAPPAIAGMPFTPEAKKALELALRECISLRAVEIGPEHLMLGIARVREGIAAGILADAHQDAGTLRQTLRSIELLPEYASSTTPSRGFRVVELTGEAADWERQLNDHAARGHELVELVGQRAIFHVVMSE